MFHTARPSTARPSTARPSTARPKISKLSLALLAALFCAALPVAAQQEGDGGAYFTEEKPRYRWMIELKSHYRSSDEESFPVPFPFDPLMLPPGAGNGTIETVEAGDHFEVSALTLDAEANFTDHFSGRLKIDFIDRYDRNPTSEDREIDVDEAWLRLGREAEPGVLPEGRGFYAKLGKFGKFERQDDRHLESYGLVSTAFNRLEDVGLEIGADFGRHFYAKASFTNGNPLFLRDPNALAGDNGTSVFANPVNNPVSELKTGIPILYDADVDTIDFENPEIGVGLGLRAGPRSGVWALDVLAWGYERELADEAPIANTFYGGDLDLLLGPGNQFPFPIDPGDNDKSEVGLNVWLYWNRLSLFAQWVDQEVAGLERSGFEFELAYVFDLPGSATVGQRRLFPWIAPAVRYSELDPKFAFPEVTPSPSLAWDWEKIDFGLRMAILERMLELTLEYQDNTFVRGGRDESNDEFLLTLRVAFEGESGG